MCISMTGCSEPEKDTGQIVDKQISSADVSTGKELTQMGNIEAATVKKELITSQNVPRLKEALDNGTILAVNNLDENEAVRIAKTFGISYEPTEAADTQALQGILIRADLDGAYQIEEVVAEIVQRTDDETALNQRQMEEQLSAIREDEMIDVELVLPDAAQATQSSRYQTLDYTVFENRSGVQRINNHTGYQYTQWWSAKPINPAKDDSYEIAPSITTKIKDAETKESFVKATCFFIYLQEPQAAGWETDVDKCVTIKFRNHKSAGTEANK